MQAFGRGMQPHIFSQTVLALWGSGGIKAGERYPPARASPSTKKVAVAAVPCVLAQKVSSALESGGPPPTALQPQQLFFVKMRRAAATVVEISFFLKDHSKYNTFVSKIAF